MSIIKSELLVLSNESDEANVISTTAPALALRADNGQLYSILFGPDSPNPVFTKLTGGSSGDTWIHAPVADAAAREALSVESGTVVIQLDTNQLWVYSAPEWFPINPKNNVASTDPTPDDDIFAGYSVYSIWVNSSDATSFICTNPFGGAANWQRFNTKNNATTSAPTVNDDSSLGYSRYSIWIDGSGDPTVYICQLADLGGAIWVKLNTDAILPSVADAPARTAITPTEDGTLILQRDTEQLWAWNAAMAEWVPVTTRNTTTTTNPSASDDYTSGYKVGSNWYNENTRNLFTSTVDSVGAAVWTLVASDDYEHVAFGDETTAITTGDDKLTFRMPNAGVLTNVVFYLTTTSSSGNPTFDLNIGGSTALSAPVAITAGQLINNTTGFTAAGTFVQNAVCTIDITDAGTDAAGPKAIVFYRRTV